MTRVAAVGLGAMESRVAQRLAAAGFDIAVRSRSAARCAAVVAAGATHAESLAAAAACADVTITMVSDPAALRAVTEGPRGLAAGCSARAR
jgi:3-hydroxyisobutyrate dehydrogenase